MGIGIYIEGVSNCKINGAEMEECGTGLKLHRCGEVVVNESQFTNCNQAVKAHKIKKLRAKGNVEQTSSKEGYFRLDLICYLVRMYIKSLKG
jgi:hypothetical protein